MYTMSNQSDDSRPEERTAKKHRCTMTKQTDDTVPKEEEQANVHRYTAI